VEEQRQAAKLHDGEIQKNKRDTKDKKRQTERQHIIFYSFAHLQKPPKQQDQQDQHRGKQQGSRPVKFFLFKLVVVHAEYPRLENIEVHYQGDDDRIDRHTEEDHDVRQGPLFWQQHCAVPHCGPSQAHSFRT
jgi:hypothetical protein